MCFLLTPIAKWIATLWILDLDNFRAVVTQELATVWSGK
jgi:hypothetical protein